MVHEGLDRVEKDFDGLVIGNEAENFSAGANLFMVVVAAQQGMWDTLDGAIHKLQDAEHAHALLPQAGGGRPGRAGTGRRLRGDHARPRAWWRAANCISAWWRLGAGVIPAGGGTKEMMRRMVNPPMRTQNADALPFLQRAFEQIGQAKVATSAEEARQMGILGTCDRVVMNREHLLTEAKREVLHMAAAGYRPACAGEDLCCRARCAGAMRVGVHMYKREAIHHRV